MAGGFPKRQQPALEICLFFCTVKFFMAQLRRFTEFYPILYNYILEYFSVLCNYVLRVLTSHYAALWLVRVEWWSMMLLVTFVCIVFQGVLDKASRKLKEQHFLSSYKTNYFTIRRCQVSGEQEKISIWIETRHSYHTDWVQILASLLNSYEPLVSQVISFSSIPTSRKLFSILHLCSPDFLAAETSFMEDKEPTEFYR